MLIQISESRWVSEPEAVWRMPHIGIDIDNEGHPKNYDHGDEWVARMPSGTLEWLSDEEYEALVAHDRFQAEMVAAIPKPTGPPPAHVHGVNIDEIDA